MIQDKSALLYFASFSGIGPTFSIVLTIAQTALIAEAPDEKRGEGDGIFESAIGTGGLIGPIFGGALAVLMATPFVAPICAYLALLAFYGIKKTRPTSLRNKN